MHPDENEFTHILYEARMYLITYGLTYADQEFTNLVRANHAIHLRNLAYFFCKNKQKKYWHVSDFVNDDTRIRLISGKLFKDIRKYSSGATGHLLNDRVSKTYKAETRRVEEKALPVMVDAIQDFLRALDDDVLPEFEQKWREHYVRQSARRVDELCTMSANGRICALSGHCEIIVRQQAR